MDIHYLTDTIFIEDNKIYYRDTKDTIQLLKNHNWHKILQEYGWTKIHKKWISKLNKQIKNPRNNSLFGCLDCGGDGDCLFHCISYSLNSISDINYKNYDSMDIRRLLCENINEEHFQQIIQYYRILQDSDDFDEQWDPYKIKTKEDLCQEIMKGGTNYWGDYILLQLLCSILQINLLILNCDDTMNHYDIYHTMIEYKPEYRTILLLYEDRLHFKLIGYFKENQMISLFTHKDLPYEIMKIYNIYR